MEVIILKGHTRPLTQVKYNHDGDLLFSCSKDNVPTVWYTATGERLGTFDGHSGTVWALDVSKDSSLLITAGADMTARIWEVKTGRQLCKIDLSGPVRCVEFAEGDKKFITITDPFSTAPTTVRVFTLPTDLSEPFTQDQCIVSEWKTTGMSDGKKRLTKVTWLPANSAVLTGDEFGIMRIHDPETGQVTREIKEHTKKINCFQWNREKTLLATASSDHTSKLFDVKNWRCLKTYEMEVPVNSAAISPIKEHVFVAGGQEAMNVTTTSASMGKFETKLFHMVFAEEFGSIKGHFGPVNTIAIHPDGIGFTSGAEDGYIRVHKFESDYFKMHSELDDLDSLVSTSSYAAKASN